MELPLRIRPLADLSTARFIDSLIIGLLCFVCMTIFGWEYTLLISCIVGITNIIPFFGPFIGAIPSALLFADGGSGAVYVVPGVHPGIAAV